VFRREQLSIEGATAEAPHPNPSEEAVVGTFLTPTGDYRYLSGGVREKTLILCCFDGTHVYRFSSRLTDDGRLEGEFWSGASGPQTWTGKRDDNASLPDGFRLTQAQNEVDWGAIQFPDLAGRPRRLDDEAFSGRVRLIYLFGSWCPNCHDAAEFFGQLQAEYGDQGLRTLGLAFEATGDFTQDVKQVEIYRTRHQIPYPLLVAGLADKEFASRSLPFLDRVRSFPTAILVDGQGRIRDVYTGFSGPATGEAYTRQGEAFRRRIETLLAEKPD
jgi:thiol-disulfide isomerase/thioredoxin